MVPSACPVLLPESSLGWSNDVEERDVPHFEGVVAAMCDDFVVPHFYSQDGVALFVGLPLQDGSKGVEVCKRYFAICISY